MHRRVPYFLQVNMADSPGGRPPTPDEQAWVDDFMNRVTRPTPTAEQSQGGA
jgi:hypothetical protein